MSSLSIYSHRSDYQSLPKSNQFSYIELNKDIVDQFWEYARERMSIWYKKGNNEAKPRTQDPILAKYRFCNVYRELDIQTIFIHTTLAWIKDNLKLRFLNLIIFRCIESIETFAMVWPHDGIHGDDRYHKITTTARPRFGTAYIFPPQIPKKYGYTTREQWLAYFIPSIIDKLIEEIQTWSKMWVIEWVAKLIPIFGANLNFISQSFWLISHTSFRNI